MATNGSSGSNGSHLREILDEVGALLVERGVSQNQAHDILDSIRAAEDAAAMRLLVGRWRAIAKTHGLRAAALAAGLSRHAFLTCLADLIENPALYGILAANLPRGEQLDADEAARLAKRADASP